MDNPHHLMLKISRLLPSSFTSCQFKNLSDVAESSINPISKHSSPPKQMSSTSNAGSSSSWFTSSDADTFFSLSSISGDSFRLIKSIHEHEASLSSTAAAGKKPMMIMASPDHHDDIFSTQLYYRSCRRRRGRRNRRKIKKSGGGGIGIGESYAVEKSSRDPRADFRASMVEMIVEKQIFAAPDLDRLLRSFLSLNSPAYHGIIFDVFSEICQTLFTN